MPVTQITPALVLRSRPFGESDKIVSLLTPDLGKITGIAKGAKHSRRRFMNALEPFSLINLHFQDYPNRSLVFIVSAELLGFKQLVTNLVKISYASYMVEITDGLVAEREENLLVFKHLKDGLCYLDENEPSLRFLTSFELILLRLTGYQPLFESCKCCGNAEPLAAVRWHFSFRDGGIFCNSCARKKNESFPIGATAMNVLKDLQAAQSLFASSILLPISVIDEIRSLLSQFIQFHIGREIKSAAFLCRFA
jgi:DNA repair protein RecO (recombination protein O)